jgi:hypothetical protein
MRGPVRAASGLPFVRLLQGPAGHHRQNGGLNDIGGAEVIGLPRFFLCALSWM